jgi:diamine N-acetyltransferase
MEPSDASLLLLWENNPSNWRVSGTEVPYSMHEMQQFIENASDVRANKQLRLIICDKSSHLALGTLDLFDINFKHKRAGVGILIGEEENRGKGYALESLLLLEEYATRHLGIINLFCGVHADNQSSIDLFKKANYKHIGTREKWYIDEKGSIDELLFQRILVG